MKVYVSILLSMFIFSTYAQELVTTNLQLVTQNVSIAGRMINIQTLLDAGIQLAQLIVTNNSPEPITISTDSFNIPVQDVSCIQHAAISKAIGLWAGMFVPGFWCYMFPQKAHKLFGYISHKISLASCVVAPYYWWTMYAENKALSAAFFYNQATIEPGTTYITYVLLDVESAQGVEIVL
ncbi:MAG TPA: hypothetical protein PLU71_03955 [Candidatus Dependentiae bacterium]|nr:hypothetical protein [Candidatus Dependentiae bacterium]HRQ62986.1 hypothetical protein [Candidatus Dependentiae bacterium]